MRDGHLWRPNTAKHHMELTLGSLLYYLASDRSRLILKKFEEHELDKTLARKVIDSALKDMSAPIVFTSRKMRLSLLFWFTKT